MGLIWIRIRKWWSELRDRLLKFFDLSTFVAAEAIDSLLQI